MATWQRGLLQYPRVGEHDEVGSERKTAMTNNTLTGLSVEEAEELHRNLIQGTQFFGMIAALAHLLAYIYSPWLK